MFLDLAVATQINMLEPGRPGDRGAIPTPRASAVYSTGMRRAEMCQLKVEDKRNTTLAAGLRPLFI